MENRIAVAQFDAAPARPHGEDFALGRVHGADWRIALTHHAIFLIAAAEHVSAGEDLGDFQHNLAVRLGHQVQSHLVAAEVLDCDLLSGRVRQL